MTGGLKIFGRGCRLSAGERHGVRRAYDQTMAFADAKPSSKAANVSEAVQAIAFN